MAGSRVSRRPGLVDEAVKNICQYFKDHPEETSYSLGTNDSSGYCRCPNCLARIDPDKKNFLGRPTTPTVLRWCNQVIEGVLKQYPDKWSAAWRTARSPRRPRSQGQPAADPVHDL